LISDILNGRLYNTNIRQKRQTEDDNETSQNRP